jgi:PAS domain S-box-containing protein
MTAPTEIPATSAMPGTVLQDYELRFRRIRENTSLGMFQLSPGPDHRVISTNPVLARMLGYDRPEDLTGKPITDLLILPSDLEDLVAALKTEGSFAGREVRLKRSDGSEIWVLLQAWTVGNAGIAAAMIEGFADDITEHKVFEQEMQYYESELSRYALAFAQANRKLNLLSSITRHDILNQLTGLILAIDMMQDERHDPAQDEYIQIGKETAFKIEQLIRFTKDYEEIGVSSPVWYSVRNGIDAAADTLSLPAGLLVIDRSAAISIYADPLIEKVFYNLMENALRHGKDLTRIAFSSHAEKGYVILVCEDNGPGVPAQYKEDIFTRKHFSHTGLGLFLSREILGITGLSISETGEPGKGARFEIRVPRDSCQSEPGAG